ncbi:MAG: hypothetical protein PHV34_23790 [Verrucomicrobiae bacterium]|nr:hypothetical protein [Verrucomicrobiae bacterium]
MTEQQMYPDHVFLSQLKNGFVGMSVEKTVAKDGMPARLHRR